MNDTMYDGRLRHPFTCVISGPSGSGKSTLILDILDKRDRLIDSKLYYITIFLGTNLKSNPQYLAFQQKNPDLVNLVDVREKYPTAEHIKDHFAQDIRAHLRRFGNKPGCLLFDDLMSELNKSGSILSDLFTRESSHGKVSSIYITQNLFAKSAGNSTDHTTVYRNAKYLILFDSPLDGTIISTVARRIAGPVGAKRVEQMLRDVVRKYRYVLITADQKTARQLTYRSEITAEAPYVHQLVFSLEE